MKGKILTSVIITVIFALLSSTTLLMLISNFHEIGRTKEILKNLNEYSKTIEKGNEQVLDNYKINGVNVRCSLINEKGMVLYDSIGDIEENHGNRDEIKKAKETGEGFAVRNSRTSNRQMVYCATLLDNGYILRSAIPVDTISFFNEGTVIYWVIVLVVVLAFSISLSLKIIRAIVEPLNDLEDVTAKIANGDLHMRVTNTGNGEIGSLGRTFNNMADQLQSQINKVMDRQNRLESILSCMESGVIAINRRGKIITINPYAKRIFGIRRDITGENISSYDEEFNILKFLQDENVSEKEVKIYKPIERELRVKKATMIYDFEKIGKVITVQDISDIKRLENMRSQFVANVSHELKTPLTSIKGFAETLKYVEDDETRKKFLDIINKESERLTRLINDILVLSKIESEGIGDEVEFFPNSEIEDVVHMVNAVAEEKNIDIIVEQSNVNLLYGDKDKFLQLVLNLVENGVKYSNEGATVIIRSYSDGEFYIIEVEDNGIGIPEEDLPHIFERFYRVDKARKSGGTGLGLAIVKHIVKCFNGEIKISSKLGIGSKFVVKIRHI
ncbi:MAG: HAMP domain-containing protein [Clostridium sp.]|nr:HAMP domain-containing protein [Clostridium sp.]